MPLSPLLQDGRALLDADRLIRSGLADRRASYELSFLRLPPHVGYLVVAGVETMLETLRGSLVHRSDLESLVRTGHFSSKLVDRLSRFALSVDIDAVPDGTVAFPKTPIASVEGPYLEAVLVGSLVLASFQKSTAIATRTARLCIAAGTDPIIDGSSAHRPLDTSLAGARAACVGGASATTHLMAASVLGIPFRAAPRVDLGALAPAPASSPDSWGDLPPEDIRELGLGDDEEAMLLEAKRLDLRAKGWIARGLCDVDARSLPVRFDLVALEQDGAWAPRRGASDTSDVVPGRKMVVRYSDDERRAIADIVHLTNERMQQPKLVGARTLTPLAKAVMRAGKTLEAPEGPQVGRERALVARRTLPEGVTHLRVPDTYRVELSPGLLSLR